MKTVNINMETNNRKLLNVRDILVIVLLLGLALGVYLFREASNEASYAVITLDGTAADRIPLQINGTYEYPQIPGMVFTVSDGKISVTESGCGDKVCVRTGAVSHMGEAIICVPNRVAVTVEGSETDLDVVLR
ncbi:MAG: NusG domain II-containing protein [Oscillospiraceae bacterium]|nr:NusG domain II-containing protein [Oscillospiraceae bacterium]